MPQMAHDGPVPPRPWWRLHVSTWAMAAMAAAALTAVNASVFTRAAGLVAGKSCEEWGWPWTWRRLSHGIAPAEADASVLEYGGQALVGNASVGLAALACVTIVFERRRRRQGRFLQLSIGDLLLATAAAGAVIAWHLQAARSFEAQRGAVAALAARGRVAVVVDSSLPDWLVDRQAGGGYLLDPFQNVLELKVIALKPAADRLRPLAELVRLERLEFDANAGVGDADLIHLAGLRRLAYLDLEDARIGNAGLAQVAGLTRLRHLRLGNTRVSGTGLAALSELAPLEVLRLNGADVDDAGLAHLRSLRRLTALDLTGTRVTDAGLAHVAGLENLERLTLYGTQITDAGLAQLQALAKLRRLDVAGTRVTPDGLRAMRRAMPQLTDLRPTVE